MSQITFFGQKLFNDINDQTEQSNWSSNSSVNTLEVGIIEDNPGTLLFVVFPFFGGVCMIPSSRNMGSQYGLIVMGAIGKN